MARIANTGQPARRAVQEIIPVHSRVIALELHIPVGIGNGDFCYTPQLGNHLWLFSVDAWMLCADKPAMFGGFFYFSYGTHKPVTGGEISLLWTPIVPLNCGIKPGFMWFACGDFHRRFTMSKLFTNDGLRFGVMIENGFNQDWMCTVAFEISEV